MLRSVSPHYDGAEGKLALHLYKALRLVGVIGQSEVVVDQQTADRLLDALQVHVILQQEVEHHGGCFQGYGYLG